MAANILWRQTVHRALQASALVSATPIAMPSKTEWKHSAKMSNMLSPSDVAVFRGEFTEWTSLPSLPVWTCQVNVMSIHSAVSGNLKQFFLNLLRSHRGSRFPCYLTWAKECECPPLLQLFPCIFAVTKEWHWIWNKKNMGMEGNHKIQVSSW